MNQSNRVIIVTLLFLFSGFLLHAQFNERALEMGIDHENSEFRWIGGGAAIFDMNNDDLPDLFLTGGLLVDKLYLNNGNGFDRMVNYLQPEDFDYYDYTISGVAVGDVNNDGYDDLLLTTFREHTNLLLINLQNNLFDVIPADSSGIADTTWSVGATFGDVNKDGLLDIFVHSYIEVEAADIDPVTYEVVFNHVGYQNNLYINQGNAVFVDRTEDYNIFKNGNTLTASFTDYDNDGDVDLYVVNDFGEDTKPNELYRNEYPLESFTDVSFPSGAEIALFGMGLAIGDYDNDLDLDYYITNIGRNVLLANDGFGSFTDMTNEAGVGDSVSLRGLTVGWGTGFFDCDNDGDLDLYLVNGHINAAQEIDNPKFNPNTLFRNDANGEFEDVSFEMGFDDPSVFRGSAFGDLNNDGMIDVVKVVTNRGPDPPDPELLGRTALYYNMPNNFNNWVNVKLRGTVSNRNGYGARLYFYDGNGNVQMREADGGSSHASANSSVIHVGIGSAASVDSIVIIWPSGIQQTIYSPTINQINHISETDETTTATQDNILSSQLKIFPNPAHSTISFELQGEWLNAGSSNYEYTISSVDGKQIASDKWSGKLLLDISSYEEGAYLFRIVQSGKILGSRKFIKLK